MKPYLVQTPKFVQRMFPKRIWAFPNSTKEVYLTFDDGPIPEVTPWVLDELKKHNAKATFFCIGDNISKHSEIFERIIAEGHTVGNHTFHHLNGRKTTLENYLENISKAETEIVHRISSIAPKHHQKVVQCATLFRPPYGKMTSGQAKSIQQKGYNIIMWDVLSADYDTSISEEKCFKNVARSIKPGSIVVFHDSLKAQKNLQYALPKILNLITENGWSCEKIRVQ